MGGLGKSVAKVKTAQVQVQKQNQGPDEGLAPPTSLSSMALLFAFLTSLRLRHTPVSFPPTLLSLDICFPKTALVFPQDCGLPQTFFRFQNYVRCASVAEHRRILALSLTKHSVIVDWLLCVSLCGSVSGAGI